MYVDSVMVGQDSEIVPALCEFYGGDRILDCTYGAGRFWRKHRPEGLVTSDLLSGADYRADFTFLPFASGFFDIVVFDPPHIRRNLRMDDLRQSVYAFYNLSETPRTYVPALKELWRVIVPGGVIIAKIADEYMRPPPWNHVRLLEEGVEVGWKPFDLIVKMRQPSIRNTSQRQHRARRRHCFFLVMKK
jgi:hypothetical protein